MLTQAIATRRKGISGAYSNASIPTGSAQTLVGAGANTTGLVVRTCVFIAPAGAIVTLRSGGTVVGATVGGAFVLQQDFVIQAGQSLEIEASAASCQAYLSWDVV